MDAPSTASKALIEIGRLAGVLDGLGGPFDMAGDHGITSGIGGMRAAGDLVARAQVAQGMRINQARGHVAGKPGMSVAEIPDPVVMNEWREDLDLGRVNAIHGSG